MVTDALAKAILDLDEEQVLSLVKEGLDNGKSPLEIVASLQKGMTEVGNFLIGGVFLVNWYGKLKGAMDILEPHLVNSDVENKGNIVIGTVQGDIHDLGKNIVVMLLKGAGYNVIDLGVDVPVQKFVDAVKDTKAPLVGMSVLLTGCQENMKHTIDAIIAEGLDTRVIIGGNYVDEYVKEYVGADYCAVNASDGLKVAREIFAKQQKGPLWPLSRLGKNWQEVITRDTNKLQPLSYRGYLNGDRLQFCRVVPQFQISALAYRIIPELDLSARQFSTLTAPMLPGVLFSLVAGLLADKFGVKRVVTIGFIISIIGVYFRFAADNFLELFILMFLSGISITLLNANAAKLLGLWFPKEQLGTAMGLYFTATGVGITFSLATSPLFPTTKSAFLTAAYVMIGVWIAWIVLMRVKPEGSPDLPVMPVVKYLGVVVKACRIWPVGITLMLLMAVNMAVSGFLPTALIETKGIEPVKAGFITSLFSFGTILGSILIPFLSDWVGRKKPFLGPIAFLGAVCLYLAWIAPQGINMFLFLLLGIFVGGVCQYFYPFLCYCRRLGQYMPVPPGDLLQPYSSSVRYLFCPLSLLPCRR